MAITATGVLLVEGSLDIETIPALKEALLDCLRDRPEIEIDLRNASSCDTAAFQVLLAACQSADRARKPLRIAGVGAAVAASAETLGMPSRRFAPAVPDGNPHAA